MDGNMDGKKSPSVDWDTDEDVPEACGVFTSGLGSRIPGQEVFVGTEESSSSDGSSSSQVIRHFLGMGFSKDMVIRAVKENGENNTEAILEALLTYSAVDNLPQEEHVSGDPPSFNFESNVQDGISEEDSCPGEEESMDYFLEKDMTLSHLLEMGYEAEEALTAIDRCGLDTPIEELSDFICAAQMAKEADFHLDQEEPCENVKCLSHQKRKLQNDEEWKGKRQKGQGKDPVDGYVEMVRHLPNPMVGFGVPGGPSRAIVGRKLPEEAIGPPYFYYENVALTPKGVWTKISRFLHDIEPEFADSKYFCAATRKRGYVHNLPIDDRFQLLPIPPLTIHEAFPRTKEWWPSWDTRTQFNCLLTSTGCPKLSDKIRKALEKSDGEPPLRVKKYVLKECKRWNLIWIGRNKVVPLEPDEIERLMGLPRDHTRGFGRTDRFRVLGNAFQIDTVGYHLSVLKRLFPAGINVLSLFSGIGGAEVTLHRLGIPLKNVVSVEISEICRIILQSWWEQTNQQGKLIHITGGVQEVTTPRLAQWIDSFGGFDLVIGGSPCNNLAGVNRFSRNGLEGEHSSLFFDYFRILSHVQSLMKTHM